jgi:hypothetical protein
VEKIKLSSITEHFFLFPDSPIDEEKVSKLSEIILASKEATGKIRMLMDVFHCENVSADDCRTILTAVASQLAECSVATRCDFSHNLMF